MTYSEIYIAVETIYSCVNWGLNVKKEKKRSYFKACQILKVWQVFSSVI